VAGLAAATVWAQDNAALRKNLETRLPQLGKIDEVSKTPVNGLLEVRVGQEIYYADPEGNYLCLHEQADA